MDVMIMLGSESDLPITEAGLKMLREMKVGYTLRIASAHRSPELVSELVRAHDVEGGGVYICVAGKSAHLAGVVASMTSNPVLAVPVYGAETAGMDALLSMCQMPKGTPVATMGMGKHGFINACLFAAQVLSKAKPELGETLKAEKARFEEAVRVSNEAHQLNYTP